MAITAPADVEQLARTLAQAAQDDPLISELWVTTRRDGVHLWLLIERSSDDEELRLYCLLDLLDERYPAADVQLHVLNPASFTIDLHEALPQDAEKIFSRVA